MICPGMKQDWLLKENHIQRWRDCNGDKGKHRAIYSTRSRRFASTGKTHQ
jgi:hypothetical protein